MILLAGVVGFILGSRAGREPYEHLQRTLSGMRRRPEVQGVVESVQDEVNQRTGELSSKVQSKLNPSKSDDQQSHSAGAA